MNAPAPLPPEPTDGLGPWQTFLCRACGLIYDEGEGDPDGGLPPGTRFADIADDWQCPVCGVTKAEFEPWPGPRARPAPAAPTAPRARRAGLVIVGGGLAGWSLAEAVRALDGAVPLTLVCACTGDAYHKPELSVAFGRGLDPARLVRESGQDRARRLGVRLMAQTFAIGIDPVRRRLRTTRGTMSYGHLVLAQGARPMVPAVLKPDLCWRINSLAAWTALHGALKPQSRIVLVGAGMVGCELADDLARAGHRVTLIDSAPLPLAGLLPDLAGRRLADALDGAGIRFLGNISVTGLRRAADGTLALATAYETLPADQVVTAIGLATEDRLARGAGLAFDRGIAVDRRTLAASVPGIHALGDCISIDGAPCRFIAPIAAQAEAIAHAVLDRPHAGYAHAAPVIRLKTRSRPVEVHGTPVAGALWTVLRDTPEALAMEQWHDGRLAARLAM